MSDSTMGVREIVSCDSFVANFDAYQPQPPRSMHDARATAGAAMGEAAMTEIWRRDGQSSSAVLDDICDPYYGSSPDFQIAGGARPAGLSCEAATFIDPMTPLGMLIVDVFGEPGVDYTRGWNSEDEAEASMAAQRWWGGRESGGELGEIGPATAFWYRYSFR